MRGSGRTTRQIIEACERALEGTSTLFVCGTHIEARYAMDLLCSMVKPETTSKNPMQVPFGSKVVRLSSRTMEPDAAQGWQGFIDFDHNAAPALDAPPHEWSKWSKLLATSGHVNARLENTKGRE